MADATRSPQTAGAAATTGARTGGRRTLVWIGAGVLALAGLGLIAHGAARQIAGLVDRAPAPASRSAAARPAPAPSTTTVGVPTPDPAPADAAAATAAAPSEETPAAAAAEPVPEPLAAGGAAETTLSRLPNPRAVARVTPEPTAGAARSTARPTHRRRVGRSDGAWIDEDDDIGPDGPNPGRGARFDGVPVYGDDGSSRWRGRGRDLPISPGRYIPPDYSGRTWRDGTRYDRPSSPPDGGGPRAGYPRSANPY